MSLSRYLTDQQVKELLIEYPHLTAREFARRFHVSGHRWVSLRKQYYNEIDKALRDLEGKVQTETKVDGEERVDGKRWVYDEYYTYNAEKDTYITFLRCAPKPIVMDGETHRAMQRAYSDWDGNPSTINEICRSFSFPRPWFVEYKARHGWTHDKEPFTNEEVLKKDPDMLVEEALEMRRNVLFQRYEQAKWKQTKEDADNWKKLLHGDLAPFNIAMEEWKPVKPLVLSHAEDTDKHSLVVAASDWQIGLKAIADNLTMGGDWNVEVGTKVIESYLGMIHEDVRRLRVNWDKCYLFNMGDLPHGFFGHTVAGTPLIMDVTRKQQYDAVFSLLTFFIEGLYKIFGSVEEIGVAGNHEGAFGWYAVARALQERYRGTKDISISSGSKQVAYKRIGNTMFILTHGKDPKGYRGQYSNADNNSRQVQIQQEVLYLLQGLARKEPDALKGVVQYAFIQGDKHFYRQLEKGAYEDFQFGSPVLGDDYADAMRLKSRPSQNCLLVSHKYGIRAPLRYYFDVRNGNGNKK